MPWQVEGSEGPAVAFIQETLHVLPVDGIFGPISKKYVMEYQRTKNIQVDGIVGAETWSAIISV
jgi:N-acetylmuramoyl-L-alanine amidase